MGRESSSDHSQPTKQSREGKEESSNESSLPAGARFRVRGQTTAAKKNKCLLPTPSGRAPLRGRAALRTSCPPAPPQEPKSYSQRPTALALAPKANAQPGDSLQQPELKEALLEPNVGSSLSHTTETAKGITFLALYSPLEPATAQEKSAHGTQRFLQGLRKAW